MIINDVSILNKTLKWYCVGIEKKRRHACNFAHNLTFMIERMLAASFLSEIMMIGRKNAPNNGNEICHLSHEITTRWEHHKAPHIPYCRRYGKQNAINSEFIPFSWAQMLRHGAVYAWDSNRFMLRIIVRTTAILCLHKIQNGLCVDVDSLTQCYVRVAH